MGSFFTRIFLWFWLSLGLLGGTLFMIGKATRPERAFLGPPDHPRSFEVLGRLALEAWLSGGVDSLAVFDANLRRNAGMKTHLVAGPPAGEGGTSDGEPARALSPARALLTKRDLLGRSLSSEQAQLAERTLRQRPGGPPPPPGDGEPPPRHPGGLSRLLLDEEGRSYAFVAEPFRPRGLPPLSPTTQAALLLAAIAITGGVCWALAGHFSSPVRRLRVATRRLAGGDLSVRVAPALGRRNDEFGQLGRDFDRMAEQIEGLIALHRRLVRDVSHELRSPLARASVALGLARQTESEEARPAHERIEREIDRLNELIRQILTLSRLEAGGLDVPAEPVSLDELVRDVAGDAEYEAQARGRTVRVAMAVPVRLRGRRELLRSALENVVRNALLHTPEGSAVEIRLERGAGDEAVPVRDLEPGRAGPPEPVAAAVEPEAGAGGAAMRAAAPRWAALTVRDHGPGVPEEALAEIFRPFYRVDESRDRAMGGAGLGLAISRAAVMAHGGTIRARNHRDGGLIVEMAFPVD